MALTLVTSGTTALTVGSPETIYDTTAVGAYAAVCSLSGFADCTVSFWWSVDFDTGTDVSVWGESVAITGTSIAWGFVSPPIPIGRHGRLNAQLSAGTPTDANMEWDIYRL